MVSDILNFGNKQVIGVDIGLSSVKLCEVQAIKKNKFKMLKYASVDLPEGCLIEDEIQKPEEIVEAIKKAIKEGGFKTRNACIGLFGPNTISKRLQLAVSTQDEVEDQVIWESEQYIPFGIDDSNLSFHNIGLNAGGGTDVLVAAARSDIVDGYKELVEQAGLKVKVADLNLFALCNVFELLKKEEIDANPSDLNVVINFGAQITSLLIYKMDCIIFSREMNIGGDMITEEIQRQMGINHLEAEDLKTSGDESGNLPEEIVEINEIVMDSFFEEIKKTIDFFMTASAEEKVHRCFITGGTSLVPGLSEGLEQALGAPVAFLEPFDKVSFNERAFPKEALNMIASKGLIALGLSMRGLD